MIEKAPFGSAAGREFSLYTLKNKNGMQVSVTELGGIITSIKVPVDGELRECVLGFDAIEDYFSEDYQAGYPYLGAIIGRNAGRVGNAQFPLNDKMVSLNANHGDHQLHGGAEGFDRKIWQINILGNETLELNYNSEDGEEGYPGTVKTTVRYILSDDNELTVQYSAETDQPTVVNLTQHTYFNFNKENSGDILSHRLMVNSDKFVPLDENLLPNGEILQVVSSNDYRGGKNPDAELDSSFPLADNEQMAGSLESPDGKVKMEVYTTQPVLHIYTGYYLPDVQTGGRKAVSKNAGICFEAQGFADAPNHPEFKSTILKPGEKYNQQTTFKFLF